MTNTLHGLELALPLAHQSIWFQLLGAFNASNLLAAYGTAQLLGLNNEESLVALSAIPPVLGRMNRVHHGKSQQVIIDYAHTPDALQKVMDTLHAIRPAGSRLIAIMGCGGNRDQQNGQSLERFYLKIVISLYLRVIIQDKKIHKKLSMRCNKVYLKQPFRKCSIS